MIVSLIAAMAENRVIGNKGEIPWDIPADRRHFRETTWGHPVIMGRKTFEGLAGPLPGRTNIVITRQRDYAAAGCTVVQSLAEAMQAAAGADEVFICGGTEIYRQALPLADRIYLTVVHAEMDGDALFPEIPLDFRETGRRELPGEPVCSFILLERRKKQ